MKIKGDVKGKWFDEKGDDIWLTHKDTYLNMKIIAHPSITCEIISRADDNSEILEFGCGSGNFAIFLASKGYKITASDYQDSAIQLTRERAKEYLSSSGLKKMSFKKIDALDMDIPDETFDLVYHVGVIEHIDIDKVLAESRRVLKSGGYFFSVVPFQSIRWDIFWKLSCLINRGSIYTQLLTKSEWKAKHEEYFTDVEMKLTSTVFEAILMRLTNVDFVYKYRKLLPPVMNMNLYLIGKKV